MKKIKTIALYLMLCTAASSFYPANAQTPDVSQAETPLFHEVMTTPSAEQDGTWWFRVERDANLPAGARYEEVKGSDLQEIIFFATMYGEKMDFRASVFQLLDIYEHHADPQYRLLAAAALHAVGDPYGMEGLRNALKKETAPRVRYVTQAALRDYDTQRTP